MKSSNKFQMLCIASRTFKTGKRMLLYILIGLSHVILEQGSHSRKIKIKHISEAVKELHPENLLELIFK